MTVDAAQRAKSEKQLVKYEEWIRVLESRQAELAKSRTTYIRVFASLPLLSFVAFFWGVRAGGAALFTGIIMGAFGIYTVLVREGDYELNLAHTRKTAAELRARAGLEGPPGA